MDKLGNERLNNGSETPRYAHHCEATAQRSNGTAMHGNGIELLRAATAWPGLERHCNGKAWQGFDAQRICMDGLGLDQNGNGMD